MGLCKCPKRKVTNLFCFEHRVNVCEYCLIENHPRCIVQSYLNWLKDSDYVPNCALCNTSLLEGEVIRLLCYDVFHVKCLEKYYRSLPSNTAPAGYRCYTCGAPIFPTPNQAGRVTEHLREVLSKYNWARVGLCLPLIEQNEITKIEDDDSNAVEDNDNERLHGSTIVSSEQIQSTDNFNLSSQQMSDVYQSQSNYWDSPQRNVTKQQRDHDTSSTVLSMDEPSLNGDYDTKTISRKMLDENLPSSLKRISLNDDPDGPDKYKRRSAWSWLKRWLKSRMLRGRGYHDSKTLPRRTAILVMIGLLALLTFIVFATKVGRRPGNDDPNFDPLLNPNIHVAQAVDLPLEVNDIGEVLDPLQRIQPAARGAR